MTPHPLARIGLLTGAVVAASIGLSSLVQAHAMTPACTGTTAAHPHATAAAAWHAEMASLARPLAADRHDPGSAHGTFDGQHSHTQDKDKKCCACCKCAPRASRPASAGEGHAKGCCAHCREAMSA